MRRTAQSYPHPLRAAWSFLSCISGRLLIRLGYGSGIEGSTNDVKDAALGQPLFDADAVCSQGSGDCLYLQTKYPFEADEPSSCLPNPASGLDVAVEKLREILDRTVPRTLSTVEELNSEEAHKVLCLLSPDGSRIVTPYTRCDGENTWTPAGTDHFFSSEELLADIIDGHKPGFVVIDGPDLPDTTTQQRVLTTVEELDSEDAFEALCIVPTCGPLRVAVSRSHGVSTWAAPGSEVEYTSAELLAHFANMGDEPAFTLIPR